jgi:hypothetical protein
MKISKYLYFYLFVIIFLMFSLLNSGCGETNDLKAMEKRSIKAVRKAYDFTKESKLQSSWLENLPLISKTLFFWVNLSGWSPPRIFYVAIDKKTMNVDYIFFPDSTQSLEMDIENFSKIIAKESIIIDQSNFENYIYSFLYLINKKSELIDSIDDIQFVPDSKMSEMKKEFPNIGPGKCNFGGANISTEFYSYSNFLGCLYKWNLIISHNGEVISYKFKEFSTGQLIF